MKRTSNVADFKFNFKRCRGAFCDPHLVQYDTDDSHFCSALQLQESDTFSKYLYFANISSGAQIPKNTFPAFSILCSKVLRSLSKTVKLN